jgi:hypothetical protein
MEPLLSRTGSAGSEHEPGAEVVDERQDDDGDDGAAGDQRQALHQIGDRGQPLAADRHELVDAGNVQVRALTSAYARPYRPFRPLAPGY